MRLGARRRWERVEYIFLTIRHQSFIGFHFDPANPVFLLTSHVSFLLYSISNLLFPDPELASIPHLTSASYLPAIPSLPRSRSLCQPGRHGIDWRIGN